MSSGFGNLFAASSENQVVRQDKLPSGTHLLALVSVRGKDSRPPIGRRAEFRFLLLQSTNPEAKLGCEYGDVFFPEDQSKPDALDSSRGRLRALVRAIAGLPTNAEPDEISAAWDEMSGDTQAARGVKIRCTGTDLTSKAGKPFVACVYEHVPQSEEDIVATRTTIDNAAIPNQVATALKVTNTPANVPVGIAARLAAAKP